MYVLNEDDEPEWDSEFMSDRPPRHVNIRRSFGHHFWLSTNGCGTWPGLGSDEWIEVVW